MHARTCVSAISTFRLSLPDDLAFWQTHRIDNVGVSVAKLEAFGWREGTARVRAAVDGGLRVVDLIGLGPFHLARAARWDEQRERLFSALDAAVTLGAPRVVFTTGPFAPLTWEEAADAFADAITPVLADARARGVDVVLEHTNSLRVDVGFVHTLRDAIDLARRLDTGVCMELNACWAERALAETIRDGVDRIRLVQVSDFRVGTIASSQRLVPGDGDIPLRRIIGELLTAGYDGMFELELIGDAILEEGYDRAIPRAVAHVDALLHELGASSRT
jgi:sugar phosphate isomerase/epimerase